MARATGKDKRIYITVASSIMSHPKVEVLSDAAFRSLIDLWCWCSLNLEDGDVPKAIWMRRTTPKVRAELLSGGLAELTPAGVHMHDYLKHQNSKKEVEALRQVRVKAGSAGGQATAAARAAQAWRDREEQAHA